MIDMEEGIIPIRKKIMQANYLFAAEFREGFLFGRVARRRICQYKPYAVINSAGTAVSIAASAAQAELRLRDPRNTKVSLLYLDSTTNNGFPWFYHGAIGIRPQQINMYLRYPESKDIIGKFPGVDPIRPGSGDDFGYVNQLNSPFEEPTDHAELVLIPGQELGAEFYNKDPDSRTHQPVLNLLFALYWVQFFSKEKNAGLIRRIASRDVPATFLTVGFGDVPFELGDTLARDWKATPMSLEAAQS